MSISAVATSQTFTIPEALTGGATGAKELRGTFVSVKRYQWIASAQPKVNNQKQ